MKKRIISLLLTGVMCLCLMPVAALAAAWYETGEVYEVYPFYVQYVGSSKPATKDRLSRCRFIRLERCFTRSVHCICRISKPMLTAKW